MIKQDGAGKWWLHFSDGRKEGPFPSQKQVMNRERQVNYFKYRNKHESALQEGIKSRFGGSYIGTRVANRKKKINESSPIFLFAVGINSALSRGRNGIPNCLVQESIGGAIRKLLGVDGVRTISKIKGRPLSASRLGKAMYSSPKAMDQAFRIYGPKSKVIKKALPTAFGKI